MIKLHNWREYTTFAVILVGAVGFMWGAMIYPHTLNWQAAEPVSATVESLMSNSTVIGAPQIRAVVRLEDGRTSLVDIPIKDDIRAGTDIRLSVYENADNPKQKKYSYLGIEP